MLAVLVRIGLDRIGSTIMLLLLLLIAVQAESSTVVKDQLRSGFPGVQEKVGLLPCPLGSSIVWGVPHRGLLPGP